MKRFEVFYTVVITGSVTIESDKIEHAEKFVGEGLGTATFLTEMQIKPYSNHVYIDKTDEIFKEKIN